MPAAELRGSFVVHRVGEERYRVDVVLVGENDTRHLAFNDVEASNPVKALLTVMKEWLP